MSRPLPARRIIGAFLFPQVWQGLHATDRQAGRLLERLAGYGINAVFTESEDYDEAWIRLAHGMGLQWYAGMTCFSDHAAQDKTLREHPELWPITETGDRRPRMEWYVGITPTYEWYAAERVRTLERVAEQFDVDGVMLDFVRWPLHWELECRPGVRPHHASFDSHTLERFARYSRLEIPGRTTAERASWILGHAVQPWRDFKCQVITQFVAEAVSRLRAVRADLTTGLFLLPLDPVDRELLAGQRLEELAPLVDCVAPMTYHAILHRDADWVACVVTRTAAAAHGKTLPALQVDSREGAALGGDWGPPVPPEVWADVVERALGVDGVAGCVAFTGTALEFDGRGRRLGEAVHRSTQG